MRAQSVRGSVVLFLSVALLTFSVYALNVRRIVPIEGMQMITSGQLCAQADLQQGAPG